MEFSVASWIFFGFAAFGGLALLVELAALVVLHRRRSPEPTSYPPFSILKPLCGHDDELKENLASHVALDYPGEYEIILGVRDETDAAYPIAQEFAAAHPDKVRVVLQEVEPGYNPKVNQLITLTKHARYEHLAVTDSNVRIYPRYLREHAALLERPNVGISWNLVTGTGEERLGAVMDNLTFATFVSPTLGAGDVVLRLHQLLGKSFTMRREVLSRLGGWKAYQDVLAEDTLMAWATRDLRVTTPVVPTTVRNIQRSQTLKQFWNRHTRWAMIRFRVLLPGVFFEPLTNPVSMSLIAAAASWWSGYAWLGAAGFALFSILYAQCAALLLRRPAFKWRHAALAPVRDVILLAAWLRGATMRSVTWRRYRFYVLANTRLASTEALERLERRQRSEPPRAPSSRWTPSDDAPSRS